MSSPTTQTMLHRAGSTTRATRTGVLVFGFTLIAIGACANAAATTWTVSTIQDDAPPGAACDAGTHTCYTLRDALFSAVPGDTIVFNLSGYTLPATIKLANGAALTPPPGVTIHGPGFDQLSISGQAASQVFVLPDAGSSVAAITVDHLTITGGMARGDDGADGAAASTAGGNGSAGGPGKSAYGGCIYVGTHNALHLNFDLVTSCIAIGGTGGSGGNGAPGKAGDDNANPGQAGGTGGSGGQGGAGGNGGGAFGGAIAVRNTAELTLDSSTISNSIADGAGGGLGGTGGAGGSGGTGGPQPCVTSPNPGGPCIPYGSGGDGGAGGTGGHGGQGGPMGWSSGGAIAAWGQVTATNTTLVDNLAIDGLTFFGPGPTGGDGGEGGSGGAGGNGGAGIKPGTDGTAGAAGAGGDGGGGGVVEGGALFHFNTDSNHASLLQHTTLALNDVIAGQGGHGVDGGADGADGWNSGGGIQNQNGGVITFWNSILAGNDRTDGTGTTFLSNCTMNSPASQENDNLSDDGSCGADTRGDPLFAPEKAGHDAYAWGGNGLPVLMPMPGSPAINGAAVHSQIGSLNTGGCAAASDERGVARPHSAGLVLAACDLGAVESDVIFTNGFEDNSAP